MTSSLDIHEVAKFEAMAREWWDPNGKFKPLHKMNPIRLKYIVDQISWHFQRDTSSIKVLDGLKILDIGCGGGLLCEPMARLGAHIIGIDAAPTNIEVASLHANAAGLNVDYQNILAEDLALSGEKFDVVLAMEIVEHVAHPASFLKTIQSLLKPNGLMIMSTLNRNTKSYLGAIVAAEQLLRWLPRGTHDWNKFIKPEELIALSEDAGLMVKDRCGMAFNPILNRWSLSHRDLSINYAITAINPATDASPAKHSAMPLTQSGR